MCKLPNDIVAQEQELRDEIQDDAQDEIQEDTTTLEEKLVALEDLKDDEKQKTGSF